MPDAVPTATPARPGTSSSGSGSRHSCTSWRRPLARPRSIPFAGDREPGSQPRREQSQPQNNRPATAESGWWRTLTELIPDSSGSHCGGSKLAATRSRHGVERSQARSTT